jgi:hypothetical protein
MTAKPGSNQPSTTLHTEEGELLSLRISVDPRSLEHLLEALAVLDFPVNPQLYHRPARVIVEFPAYSERVKEVRTALGQEGFDAEGLEVAGVLR